MITKALDQVLRNSYLIATHLGHEMITLEHMLHAIFQDMTGARILRSCGTDLKELETDIEDHYRHIPTRRDKSAEPLHTLAFRRTVQRTLIHSQSAEQEKVDVGDLLVSMFAEEESHAVYFLEKQDVNRLDVLNYVAHRIAKPGFEQPGDETGDAGYEADGDHGDAGEDFEWDEEFDPDAPGEEDMAGEHDESDSGNYDNEQDDPDEDKDVFGIPEEPGSGGRRYHARPEKAPGEPAPGSRTGPSTGRQASTGKKKTDLLALYTEEWTAKARNGDFDQIIGRDMEIGRSIEILCRRQKNNPIYVGDPGVGKTAITQGLAQKIVAGEVPERIHDFRIYALDLGSLLAGTKFRGDFEARLKGVLRALQKRRNVILFIDEIHNIIGAGAAGSSTLDASNMLKPLLADGRIRCIGATTFEEYKNLFEKDRALSRRFQKIEVDEPDVSTTVEILKGLKGVYEEYHGLKITQAALESAARLSAKYLTDRRLPDKAIDVIDEACSQVSLRAENRKQVGTRDIEALVSKMARVPVHQLAGAEKEGLRDLESELNRHVYGQEQAVKVLVAAVKRSRAGLGNESRPIGSFLFSGPTGVGKTELCRQAAEQLGIPLIRFDMSEYMEKHTVSRLIGAPAGYVGFEQGGLLTDAIRRQPNSVLLLDEIEKAHPDIFNILLQIMDYATATDNTGRKADFRNVLLVMTSNVGSREMSSSKIGFGGEGASKLGGDPKKAIEKHFSPEFRNRLDDIVIFRHLDRTVVESIVYKFIRELEQQLKGKNVRIHMTKKAVDWLADKGYDPAFGARPMARVIQESIKDRLVDEMLFGKLQQGGTVTLSETDGELTFRFGTR
jgi:ATP-dependent Clp protease ATP-binding subunit ClpA